MRAWNLITQLAIMSAILAAFNFYIGSASRKTVASQLLTKCSEAGNPTDVFLGNSLMAAGFDEKEFQKAAPKSRPLNAACGSTGPLEHYLILDQVSGIRNGTVHYGFYDTQLTQQSVFRLSELTGNNTVIFKADLRKGIALLVPESGWSQAAIWVCSKLPVYYERMALWAKVEKMRRNLASIGARTTTANRFGNAEDFNLLEPEDAEKHDRDLDETVNNNKGMNRPILEIIKLANEKENKVSFILMPMTSTHRTKFNSSKAWISYLNYLQKQIEISGCRFISALDWIEDSGFEDHLHLNPEGAKEFTKKYADFLNKTK